MSSPDAFRPRLSRRAALGGAAAALAALAMPARAQAVSENATLTLPGGRMVGATLYLPPKVPAPAVLMVHDRFGMTDVLRERAAALALDRYVVLCADLFHGKVAETPIEAERLAAGLDREEAVETVAGWANWIRADARCSRSVGLLGFGLGGEMAAQAAMQTPVQALVVYYAALGRRPELMLRLTAPLLGHYSERNREFGIDAVEDLQFQLQKSNKKSRVHLYDADPDFANPASPQFARSDALLAWNRTVAFFRANLGAGA
ncbi:MAG: dienelactone hydrolase family protein [Reyranellaceae bacterium]